MARSGDPDGPLHQIQRLLELLVTSLSWCHWPEYQQGSEVIQGSFVIGIETQGLAECLLGVGIELACNVNVTTVKSNVPFKAMQGPQIIHPDRLLLLLDGFQPFG